MTPRDVDFPTVGSTSGPWRGEDAGGREEAQDIQHDPKRRQPAICSVPPASGLPIAKMRARVALIAGTQKWRFTSPIPPLNTTKRYREVQIGTKRYRAVQSGTELSNHQAACARWDVRMRRAARDVRMRRLREGATTALSPGGTHLRWGAW